MGTLLELRREGKVGQIGVSNFSVAEAEAARKALGGVPLASVQSEFSLLRRGLARDVLPWVVSQGVGFLAYSPLAQGVLAGKRLDGDTRAPLAQLRDEIAATLGPIARAHSVGTGEVALAWALVQPGISAVIGGASDPAQVAALARAATLRLHPDEVATGRSRTPPR
jgi:aryl-alcohol dehydrogenase-like predicted oxidoreductase